MTKLSGWLRYRIEQQYSLNNIEQQYSLINVEQHCSNDNEQYCRLNNVVQC